MAFILDLLATHEDLVKFYSEHSAQYEGDAGIDLYVPYDTEIPPGLGYQLDLGVKSRMVNQDGKTVSYLMFPRSSMSKTPLRLANSVGVIDSGYRGTLRLALDNHSSTTYTLKAGERLVQICAFTGELIKLQLVKELDDTIRGEQGFGSSGK